MNKRLLKSEFFDGKKDFANRYMEVFKNPTSKEINIAKTGPGAYNCVRGIIERNGTLYVWSNGLLHSDALKLFTTLPDGIHINEYMDGSVEFFLLENTTIEYFTEAVQNCKTLLNLFSPSSKIEAINCSYYGAKRYPEYSNFLNLSDILNYKPNEKLSRLIRKD